MTAENNGTGAPQGDDPFAYLYRREDGGSEEGAAQQPGVPRRSYNQVRAVGERQYGGQQAQPHAGTGYAAAHHGQGPGGPSAHYAAPETMPGGRSAARRYGADGTGHGRGRGGNRNGLLIVAVGVVAAVVIGIGTAMLFNDGDDGTKGSGTDGGASVTGGTGENQGPGKTGGDGAPVRLPKEDAVAMRLAGGAHSESAILGAEGRGGAYVAGMNAEGSGVTWDTKVPKAGTYKLKVRYSVPGKDMRLSLAVNGEAHAGGINMSNFARAEEGDWAKGWTTTFATVRVGRGPSTFVLSCQKGDTCEVNLDQMWLEPV